MMRVIQWVLLAAVFPLLIMSWIQINRIQKKIREKDGEAVLRENKRLAAANAVLLICFVSLQVLGECLNYPDIPLWAIILKTGWAVIAYLSVDFFLLRTFERKGNELKKDGQ